MLIEQAPVAVYLQGLRRTLRVGKSGGPRTVGDALRRVDRADDGRAGTRGGASPRPTTTSGESSSTAAATRKKAKLLIAGEERSFQTVKFPNVDDVGEITGIWEISTEVTDRKRAEDLAASSPTARERAIEELRASRQETVDRLTRAIELHDADTGEHVNRMATVAAFLGQGCGLEPRAGPAAAGGGADARRRQGRHSRPDPAQARAADREPSGSRWSATPTIGHEILAGSESELLQMAAKIALTHHERWDGGGYPRGLRGEEIPIEGRIVAVADVFDALLSDRSYRPALPVDEVVAMFRAESGTHFDPDVVALLLDNLDQALALRG